MIKKILACVLSVVMLIGVMTACSTGNNDKQTNNDDNKNSKKLSVVCTIFPEYDWVKQILGDHFKDSDVTMLLDNGVDLHSYQPTADDIIKVSSCDVFIYVGGESDAWVDDALKQSTNKNMIVINLLNVLGDTIKEEEVKEGMQGDEDEGDADEDEGPEYDEHVWLSVKNAITLCNYISDKLCIADSNNKTDYENNTKAYVEKLSNLDKQYQSTVDSAKHKTLLFGDRFPFRYFVDDYKLDYYAAFVGCSAETEASFETIAYLAKKVDDLGLSNIMTIEGAQHKIAETIISNTKDKNQNILVMDSMQSTTSKDVKNGTTYLSVMEKNLETLKTALN